MKTAGIVAEYNPFHQGHAYQIQKTKEETGANAIVVILSGSFVQRGEVAIADKWTRTKAALMGGADLVLELPAIFALSAAPSFAFGAVQSLIDSGLIDLLSFGVENATEKNLKKLASFLLEEPPAFSAFLKEQLAKGLAYPVSLSMAIKQYLPKCASLVETPNNILALEYTKTVLKKQSTVSLFPLPRHGEGYHSQTLSASYPSASALRKAIQTKNIAALQKGVPPALWPLYQKAWEEGRFPFSTDSLFGPLQYALLQQTPGSLREILEVEEGLEHRLLRLFSQANSWEELLCLLQSRRYSRPQLSRLLIHVLLGQTTSQLQQLQQQGGAPYLRVLGYRKESAFLLSKLHQTSRLPVVTSVKDALATLPPEAKRLLKQECFATNLAALCSPSTPFRTPNQDYTHPLLRL